MAQLPVLERETIVDLVIATLRSAAEQMKEPPRLDTVDESTYLLGRKAPIDSVALVTLIVDLEQILDEEYGMSLALANEQAMSMTKSPYRTVQSLTDYILTLIREAGHDK